MKKTTKIEAFGFFASLAFGGAAAAQGGPPAYAPPVIFPVPAPAIAPPPPGTPANIFLSADVNNDGAPDLIHLNAGVVPATIYVQLAALAAYVVAPPSPILPVAFGATAIACGDLDLDGFLDIVVLSPGLSVIGIMPGDGTGFFAAGPLVPIPAAPSVPMSMNITEVTGDGLADILILADSAGGPAGVDSIEILTNVGGLAFVAVAGAEPIGPGATSFTNADLDNDGDQDIVTLRTVPTNAFYIHEAVAPAVFVPGPTPIVAFPAGPVATTTFQVADLDADLFLDLVTYRPGVASIYSLLGTGALAYAPILVSPAPLGAVNNFTIGDMNGDGILDANYSSPAPLGIVAELGTGFGGFAPPYYVFPLPGASFWQAVADLNVDGKLDVATLSSAAALGDGVWVHTNIQPDPPAVAPYGAATPGCRGAHGMLTNGAPVAGTPGFGFTSTNAPKHALGLLFITDAASAPADPFGIGALFVLDFFATTTFYYFDMVSPAPAGSAFVMTGIPADPGIVGLDFYAESAWLWPPREACAPSPLGLSTSAGVALTILP